MMDIIEWEVSLAPKPFLCDVLTVWRTNKVKLLRLGNKKLLKCPKIEQSSASLNAFGEKGFVWFFASVLKCK